jgi:hypothetical protein
MLELKVKTWDRAFVDDLNSAEIEGARAAHRPTLAYDSPEHIFEIVIMAATPAALRLVADWIAARLKAKPTPQDRPMIINNQTITKAETVVTIINNYVGTKEAAKDKE